MSKSIDLDFSCMSNLIYRAKEHSEGKTKKREVQSVGVSGMQSHLFPWSLFLFVNCNPCSTLTVFTL